MTNPLDVPMFSITSPPVCLTLEGAGVTAAIVLSVNPPAGYTAVITGIWHYKLSGELLPEWHLASRDEVLYRSILDTGTMTTPTQVHIHVRSAVLTARLSNKSSWRFESVVAGQISGYYEKEPA